MCCDFLFFQAEDGIRDLVRSRGLGDVYKRQAEDLAKLELAGARSALRELLTLEQEIRMVAMGIPVSYTHLTLPTSDLV